MEEKDQDVGPADFMQLTPTGKQLEEEEEMWLVSCFAYSISSVAGTRDRALSFL